MGNAEHFKDSQHSSFRDALSRTDSPDASAANSFRDEVNSKPAASSLGTTVSKSYTVLKDMAYGAADELVNHQGTLLSDMVFGAGMTSIAKAEPKIALGAAAATVGILSGVAADRPGSLWQTIQTATGPDSPDFQPKFEAEQRLQKLGAKSVEVAAAIVGGLIAHKMLGRPEKIAAASVMNDVSGVASVERVGTHFTESLRNTGSIHVRPQIGKPGDISAQF